MTFRAVVRDGMININTHGELPDGTVVEVSPVRRRARKTSTRSARKSTKATKTAKTKANPLLALAGIWKDRPDWRGKSTLEIQRELRTKAMGGRNRG